MKITDDLPRWFAWPLRLVLYVFVMFILYNVALGIVRGRLINNTAECSSVVSTKEGGLKFAKGMVTCLRQKNGFLESLLMRPVSRAIDAMPNTPGEFVGTWDASQPRCSYRHKLGENGEFTSEPRGCSLSSDVFRGTWGVYNHQMIWLSDGGRVWPPDINPIDVVDKDFFLLVEQDGTRTRFTRVADSAKDEGFKAVPGSPDAAVTQGYDWARENGIVRHADCREKWTDANHDSLVRMGCDKYVTEVNVVNVVKPRPVHNGWDDGTTTAQCVAEVHAYWDPILQDYSEQGEDQVVRSRIKRQVEPALKECENFDNIRIGRVIHQPQLRLNAMLDKVRSGRPLSEEDKMTVQKDYPGVWEFPPDEYRTQYLNAAEELFRLVGGRERVLTDRPWERADPSRNGS